ncbi:PREDICTED: interleukin-17F-like [Crocodylus porosus]|uniref:interleukin-17F-like n=1 Tax=Crocodylus porosus TaxID=8502 RepID=UPI00093F9993|nr:PREDICTED: interleukin-17F-like [Crocodylus porosus]
MKAFIRSPALFSSLLLVLILMLSIKNSAHGRAVGPQLNKGRGSEQKTRNDCPTEMDSLFPTSVEVSINISNMNDTTKMAQDVNLRSLSPWNYSITKDPNRFPQVIIEAKCRHYSCVDSTGREDHSVNSVPIQQEILVLRRKLRDCQHVYRLEKQLITVGCTCVTPLIQHQS